jgi:hypothetical protein
LQEACYLPDESDYLTEGKTVMPIDMLSSTYKRFLAKRTSYAVTHKGGKGKGKGAKVKATVVGYLKKHHVLLRRLNSTC